MARFGSGQSGAPGKPTLVKRAAPVKKVVVAKQPPPVTDVQSSGSNYGVPKANQFKKTTLYKQTVGAAKPVRQTDITSSSKSPGGGYGTKYAHAYVQYARDNVSKALAGKPFDPAGVAAARDLHIANELRVLGDGTVIHIHHRDILPDIHTVLDPKKGGMADMTKQSVESDRQQRAGMDAPVLAVLNQTARPFHAVAGLVQHGAHGFTEGLLHNKPYTFGKALSSAGVPKGIAGPVGFGLDVAADPTTYVSFGAGSVARHAAEKAAVDAASRALKSGFSEAGAETVARAAAKRAATAAPEGKGLTVKFAGRSVPGATKGTGAAGRVIKRAAEKAPAPVKAAGAGARKLMGDVRPQLRPVGVSEAEHTGVRAAGRQARSQARVGIAEAERRAQAARRLIPKEHQDSVVAAIETNKIGSLPAHLQQPARDIRDSLRHAKRIRQQAGVVEGDVTKAAGREGAAVNYFPHMLTEAPSSVAHDVPVTARKGIRKVKLQTSKQRSDLRPIAAQNAERVAAGEAPFSTNVPAVLADYHAGTAAAVASKDLAANLMKAGRPFKDGMVLHPDDRVFSYKNGDLTPVKDASAVKVSKVTGKPLGQHVVLNRQTVEREFANIAPQADRTAFGAVFDRGTAAFKRIATATPGFHARNLVGDTQMAYLKQPGYRLPGNVAAAGRAVKRLSKVEVAQTKTLGRIEGTAKTIKVAGKPTNVDAFLADAQKQGVIRSGYIGRELREQGKGIGAKERVGGALTRAGHRVNRWMQNREDLMRLATYKHGLDKGLTSAQAAELSLGVHIDYGDLTKFERTTARRVMPFYTFSARALPIHAKALIQTPGKFANIEKAREEIANSTGVDLKKAEKGLRAFQARQAPLILQLGGKKYVLSDSLPLNLLNEVPTSGNVGAYINELSQWVAGLTNPILKDPVELYANRSFFFRSDIQSKDYPLVAAPSWVGALPQSLKAKLGVVPDYVDKRTGKKTWGWYGKSDYIFKSIPGLVNYAQQLMTEATNRRGQGQGQKILGVLTGIRSEPLDPGGAALEILSKTHDRLQTQVNAYGRRAKTPTNVAAHAKLQAELHDVERQIHNLSVARGDKVPLYPNARGSQSTVKLDTQIAILRDQAARLKASGQASENGGYETKQYADLQSQISDLEKQRAQIVGPTGGKPLKQRPLSTREQIRQEIARLHKQDVRQQIQDEISRIKEQSKVNRGG